MSTFKCSYALGLHVGVLRCKLRLCAAATNPVSLNADSFALSCVHACICSRLLICTVLYIATAGFGGNFTLLAALIIQKCKHVVREFCLLLPGSLMNKSWLSHVMCKPVYASTKYACCVLCAALPEFLNLHVHVRCHQQPLTGLCCILISKSNKYVLVFVYVCRFAGASWSAQSRAVPPAALEAWGSRLLWRDGQFRPCSEICLRRWLKAMLVRESACGRRSRSRSEAMLVR